LDYPSHCVLLDYLQARLFHSAKPQDIKELLAKHLLLYRKQNDLANMASCQQISHRLRQKLEKKKKKAQAL
jgi:hypothetical protein